MKTLTIEDYRANPALREQLEREVRRARAQAVHRYVIAPLLQSFRGRQAAKPGHLPQAV